MTSSNERLRRDGRRGSAAAGEGDEAGGAVDQIVGLENALFDRGRRRDDLEGRARLVDVLNRPVPPRSSSVASLEEFGLNVG